MKKALAREIACDTDICWTSSRDGSTKTIKNVCILWPTKPHGNNNCMQLHAVVVVVVAVVVVVVGCCCCGGGGGDLLCFF